MRTRYAIKHRKYFDGIKLYNLQANMIKMHILVTFYHRPIHFESYENKLGLIGLYPKAGFLFLIAKIPNFFNDLSMSGPSFSQLVCLSDLLISS